MSDAEQENNKRPGKEELPPTASFSDLVLGPGSRIGRFRIERELGRGAVGVVYLAHDTKLDRPVAIKSLSAEVTGNRMALSRWKREARLLASLNHPNIATIHEELEVAEGVGYLVLEYVPGQTLSELIAQGPVKLEEALSITLQIAEAVAAAHEHGVIHRDLKPGNIKITPEGKVKVLDFGLAKTVGGEPSEKLSTTTEPGKIIGTPAYMSPEQARGNPTDERSDIWSFACVLYEMLTGMVPFKGETVSDTIANILDRVPDWDALPKSTPANIQVLLRRCLEKDPRRRLQHIGDAAIEISETMNLPVIAPPVTRVQVGAAGPKCLERAVVWSLGGLMFLIGTVAVWTSVRSGPSTPTPVVRFPLSLARNQTPYEVIVSPNGDRLVYVVGVGATTQLFVREPGQIEDKELPDTKGAIYPFFSPDGQWVGFFAGGQLNKLFLDGGKPIRLCDAANPMGGCWGADGMIYFCPEPYGGLWKVSADGGKPEQVTTPDPEKGELGHWFPETLPGGGSLLFTIWKTALSNARVAVLSQKTGKWRTLVIGGSGARYSPTGHLLYAQSGTLMAAPFDLKQFKVGKPHPVLEGLAQFSYSGFAPFSFSRDGLLCYVRGGEWLARRQLVWVNRQGEEESLKKLPPGAYTDPRVSPNGRSLAFTKFEGGYYNIWVHKFASGTTTQLTFKSDNLYPIWTPDGARLTFTTYRAGPWEVYWMPADGSSTEEPLLTGPNDQYASSWSPDGKVLLFTKYNLAKSGDILSFCTEDPNSPQPLLHESYSEYNAVFSPDGHWIAYQSNQEGRDEVYVTRYPVPGEKYKVSTDGGCEPLWSPDGRELFYRNGDKVRVVTVDANSSRFDIAKPPETLFEGQYSARPYNVQNYDITPDGQRFMMVKDSEEQPSAAQLIVVLNWFEELKRLVPSGKK